MTPYTQRVYLMLTAALAVVGIVMVQARSAQRTPILRDVKVVQVDPTVIPDPKKVKGDDTANLVQESLRNALRDSKFEVGDAPLKAYFILDEYSAGSTATRVLVGFGAGRSTIDGRLVFQDAEGKELANVKIRVRGDFWMSSYDSSKAQSQQATNAFDKRLREEIARLK